MLRRAWDWLMKPAPVEQPRAWAVFMVDRYSYQNGAKSYSGKWVKVVAYGQPDRSDPRVPEQPIGPFRSEVDCDEFVRGVMLSAPQEPKEPWQE